MVLNKFAFLTRQGLGKTLTHVPQTFVAGTQSSYASSSSPFAPFGNHASGKFGKAGNAHLHTSFQGPSSPAAVQSKTAPGSQNHGDKNDSGLAAYYDAWQKQHQPGTEEKEWKQFQFTKRIGWKAPTAAVLAGRAKEREELGLRSDARLEHRHLDRAYSANAVDDIKNSDDVKAEAEALASVDEAIAKEISQIKESADHHNHRQATVASVTDINDSATQILDLATSTTPPSVMSGTTGDPSIISGTTGDPSVISGSTGDMSSLSLRSSPTDVTPESSVESADCASFSKQIITLKDAGRYAEIPPVFELMLAKGIRPTIEAYNGLLAAVINMPMAKHQRVPKALDVYTSMLQGNMLPDPAFNTALIELLSNRALYVSMTKKAMDKQRMRFGPLAENGRSSFKSKDTEYDILAEDNALKSAIRIFDASTQSSQDQLLSSEMYRLLVIACAFHGELDEMLRIYSRMEVNKIVPTANMFPPMIEAFGACGDLASLVVLYDGYRTLAIANNLGNFAMQGRKDNEVYAAVIKAYARWGRLAGGERFLRKIMESYVPGIENRQAQLKATQDAVLVNALIQQSLDSGDFHNAFELVEKRDMTALARDEAFVNISATAADSNVTDLATTAYHNIQDANSGKFQAAIAMLALHIRKDEVRLARGFWSVILASPQLDASFVEPAAMYATALIRNGHIDEALTQSREAFARIRASVISRSDIVEEIDEAIEVVGTSVAKQGILPSGPATMCFLRAMVENRGLVSPIAEQLMAGLGPQDILGLSWQDLTLALQVQADMLAYGAPLLDVAHAERFAHLVGIVTASRMPPDRYTFERVERAAQKLSSQRPELLAHWQNYQRSFITPPLTPVSHTPQPITPVVANGSLADSYDPYAATTDILGSNFVTDELDSHRSGTAAALDVAKEGLLNMRRIGRHPRYMVYSKLITAAAKENRADYINEILGMAQQDIPLVAQYPIVRHGWSLILDAMVGASLTMGNRELARHFHQELLNIGSAPTANTFGLYITTLKNSTRTLDEASEAVRIFQEAQSLGVEPSSFLYNALIGKLGKARRIDDCLHHFTDMHKLGIRPTSVTYGTVVNACCRVSNEQLAEQLFEEMESQPNYKPRPAPYNSLMQFFLTTKCDRKKVLWYYERMRSINIRPTMHTYKLLIDTYATLKPVDFAAAEGVLQTIRASGQKPEAVHYASLIHAKGRNLQDMDGAKQIFDQVMDKREVPPQACLYQALFESMVANHNVAAAEPILIDMATRGVEMTPYIANQLIRGWANERNIPKAQAIYDSMSTAMREPSTYDAMTRAYLSIGNRAGAIDVVNEMKSKRYPAAVENKVVGLLGSNTSQAESAVPAAPQIPYTDLVDAQYA